MPVFLENGTGLRTKKEEKIKEKEPEEFRVVLLNDHYTTMDFVVDILISIFHKSEIDATEIMMDVHRKGRGVVGLYPWDIAKTKTEQVHVIAREHDFPLRCIIEKV
ncbi:MAG: ATP-dependent Clp protease adaptor ClpS [Spirochaetaceae bacterium]|jgi:ATP-dependent Clp protease adaptor protein ClpS|nr:ATP-dependent Clp protease adaptor ClpS [Spirochaetaceae bacterium]